MNARDKFLANMAFEPGAPVLKWEYGYWAGTIRRWQKEGLAATQTVPESMGEGESVRAEGMGVKPNSFSDLDVHRSLNLDEGFQRVPANNFICPGFPEEILEDHDDWVLRRNSFGVIVREMKDHSTPSSFVGPPVHTWEDWEKIKAERLQPNLENRLPKDWPAIAQSYQDRSFPLILGGGQGFYGSPRYLLGDETLLTTFYDNPQLILDINEHLCNLWITLYDRVLQDTTVDMALIWEDMCYRNGPLISPAMFNKFMLPFYKRLTGFFRDHNIRIIFVDTDGNFWKLIPNFLEGGVTGFFPFEANADMNVAAVRAAYPRLQMLGGVDKTKIALDREAIDQELKQKVEPILSLGGFIPTIDHLVPPEVSWPNFSYYRGRLNDLIDQAAGAG